MMVGKRMRDHLNSGCPQDREKPIGIANAGDPVDGLTIEPVKPATGTGRSQRIHHWVAQFHSNFSGLGHASRHQAVDFCQTGLRLAQRTRWQTPPIAKAPRAIHHGDFQVSFHSIMLQAIVADNHIATGVRKYHPVGHAVGSGDDRAATPGGDQYRFIAGINRRCLRSDRQGPLSAAAPVSACNDARMPPSRAQVFHHPDHQWSLPGSPDRNVADHNNRNWQPYTWKPPPPIESAAQRHEQAKKEAQRPKQNADGGPGLPDSVQIPHARSGRRVAELQSMKACVDTVARQQFRVVPRFDNFPCRQHHDPVSALNGR